MKRLATLIALTLAVIVASAAHATRPASPGHDMNPDRGIGIGISPVNPIYPPGRPNPLPGEPVFPPCYGPYPAPVFGKPVPPIFAATTGSSAATTGSSAATTGSSAGTPGATGMHLSGQSNKSGLPAAPPKPLAKSNWATSNWAKRGAITS